MTVYLKQRKTRRPSLGSFAHLVGVCAAALQEMDPCDVKAVPVCLGVESTAPPFVSSRWQLLYDVETGVLWRVDGALLPPRLSRCVLSLGYLPIRSPSPPPPTVL